MTVFKGKSTIWLLLLTTAWYAGSLKVFLVWKSLTEQPPLDPRLLLLTWCAGWAMFGAGFGTMFGKARLAAVTCATIAGIAATAWWYSR